MSRATVCGTLGSMCGRYASFRETQDLADAFAVTSVADDVETLPASWNVAPTDGVRMVVERPERLEDGSAGAIERSMRLARWGLVPSWAKDPSIGSRMINARAETVATKPAFARAMAVRRALLPADGYYEWQPPPEGASARTKQPFYIHGADGAPLALAGLYEFWKDPTKPEDDPGRWLVTTTVITTTAVDELGRIHDRQPIMLPPDAWDAWLDPAVDADGATRLLSVPAPPLTATPVSRAVNSVRNDGPELIRPVDRPADAD